MKKSRFLIVLLLCLTLLMTACGGSGNDEPEPAPTEIPPATEEPTQEPEPTTIPQPDDSDFPPGTRLSTVDPLAANGENNIVLLASVGDVLVVGVEPSTGQDLALGLFHFTASGSDELFAQVNDGTGFESMVHTFQVAGAYRLAIRELNGADGQYALRIATSPGIALYVAPHHEVAGKLEGEDLGYLHNGYAGQATIFNVMPAPGYFDLDLSLSIVSLLDMGTVLMEVDEGGPGEGESAIFIPPADDEYLISVRAENGSTGVFNLTMAEP